jgi:hypothetical protein
LQLLEAAQNLSLSLTRVNRNDVQTDAIEEGTMDKTDDANKLGNGGEGSAVTHEMDPDEV